MGEINYFINEDLPSFGEQFHKGVTLFLLLNPYF